MGIEPLLGRKDCEGNSILPIIAPNTFQMPPRETMSKLEYHKEIIDFLDTYATKSGNNGISVYHGDAGDIILINSQLSVQRKDSIIFKKPELNKELKQKIKKLEELS